MTATRLTLAALLAAALPSLAAAQVPPIQSPPGLALDASNAVLPNALSNLGGLPHVATNAALAATTTASYPNGVWRDHYATGGWADGPLYFGVETGTCAANGWVNDGGMCVDDAGGNSFKAVHRNNIFNVKEFGAKGDNSTNDTAAIQAAITAAQNATPGIYPGYVAFPSGNYCIKTGGGVTSSSARLTLIGYGNAIVKSCGNTDTTIITLNGNANRIADLQLQGWNSPSATQTTLVIGSSCVECVVDSRTTVAYGYYPITVAAGDAVIKYVKAQYGYGPAIARATKGSWWSRDKFDQDYPAGAPTPPYTLSAWANGHVYVAKDLVTIASGAWVLQATAGGTSGGSEPVVAAYGSNITDGGVTWQLAMPGTYYALQLDSGAFGVNVERLDATGSFTYGVALTNDTGGNGPQSVILRDVNIGSTLSGGVYARQGQGLAIEGGQSANCVLANCKGVNLAATWTDKVFIGAGWLAFSNPYGVYIGGGGGAVVNGASIHGASVAGVDIAAGVTKFVVTGSDLSTGPTWGTNAIGVNVEAGASDYYAIANNLVQGSTTLVIDGGTGTHKSVMGNN